MVQGSHLESLNRVPVGCGVATATAHDADLALAQLRLERDDDDDEFAALEDGSLDAKPRKSGVSGGSEFQLSLGFESGCGDWCLVSSGTIEGVLESRS